MCPAQKNRADALLNPLLVTFRHVAASGSFNRAADGLFLSATAVRKQMNLLEDALGVVLFTRGKKGIRLTVEGKTLLEGLAQLSGTAADVLARARPCAGGAVFRVGTSFLNPASVFIELLRALDTEGEYAVELVPFDDGRDGILAEIGRLGRDYDFLVGACDSKRWIQRCHFHRLGEYAMCCAVPRGHRLAEMRTLALGDLAGETVVLGERGDSDSVDRARSLLERQGDIRLENGPFFYDLDIFNACAREGKILLTLECWRNAHPAFVTIP
ncbi:MAG: LysR family transcriptional regulator, partial [Desulfovibrio sp.]|nr:LysR family transcriptional regulator [Desulfovibrio sp.]